MLRKKGGKARVSEPSIDGADLLSLSVAEHLEEPKAPVDSDVDTRRSRFPSSIVSLRRHAASGTIVNAAYFALVSLLTLAKGVIAARLLTTDDYAIWGLLSVALATVLTLKQVGINDRFVQQDEPDQDVAFRRAFTAEVILMSAIFVAMLCLIPVLTLAYDEPQLLVPGLLLALTVPGATLQFPLWGHYRQLDFRRQRRLQSTDPVLSFMVSVVLLVAGFGYWSLLVGAVVGAWAGGIVAVRGSLYRLGLDFERGTLKKYASFSTPLTVAALSGIAITQSSLLVADQVVGLAGVAAIILASLVMQYAQAIDAVLTQTIYPVICAVSDRADLLFEAFVKSNRLTLIWGMPFGIGIALFAAPGVDYIIGEKWTFAVFLLQVIGVVAAIHHVGFNWEAFYRARGETKPVAVLAVFITLTFFAVAIPLLISDGLDGFAIGLIATEIVAVAVKIHYLSRIFPRFSMLRQFARAAVPTALAGFCVVILRELDSTPSAADAAVQLFVFVLATLVATLMAERKLLVEAIGYLRRNRSAPTPA